MQERCGTCKFFEALGPGHEGKGECRRQAPAPIYLPHLPHSYSVEGFSQRWPIVTVHDWCGEYVAANAGSFATGQSLTENAPTAAFGADIPAQLGSQSEP